MASIENLGVIGAVGNIGGCCAGISDGKIDGDNVTFSFKMSDIKKLMGKHPLVPKEIICIPDMRTTKIIWEDDTVIEVTCATDDYYTWEGGYNAALVVRAFGCSKKEFKNKWFKIISRRVHFVSSNSTADEIAAKKAARKLAKEKKAAAKKAATTPSKKAIGKDHTPKNAVKRPKPDKGGKPL
jgi:hypothetical protein